jgi:hypothetical protein
MQEIVLGERRYKMHIFNFSIESDQEQLRQQFQNLFQKHNFIPLIGSGFAKGSSACAGVVPSIEELKAKLVELIAVNSA